MNTKAVEIAMKEARAMSQDPDAYEIKIDEEHAFRRVIFVPKRGGYGGGFEIRLDKTTHEVQGVVWHQ